jgi:hypothetical protein
VNKTAVGQVFLLQIIIPPMILTNLIVCTMGLFEGAPCSHNSLSVQLGDYMEENEVGRIYERESVNTPQMEVKQLQRT